MAKKKAAVKKTATKKKTASKRAATKKKVSAKKTKITKMEKSEMEKAADAKILLCRRMLNEAFVERAAMSDILEGDHVETANGSVCQVMRLADTGDVMLMVIRGGHNNPKYAGSQAGTQYAVNVNGGLATGDVGNEKPLHDSLMTMIIKRKVDLQIT